VLGFVASVVTRDLVGKISRKSQAKKRGVARSRNGGDSSSSLLKAMERSGLLREGDRVGVAVSGGADSVALLLLLVELRKRLGLSLVVLHFNHQLRGRAAMEDQKFVARLAENLKLPFLVGTADVGALAKGDKGNVEDAARRARYSFFAQASGEQNLDKIAVAHTADDQAETVLAHMLRGSGITGLGGIHPQVGKVIRPLLSVARGELRSFLKSRRQKWREDATNRDVTKTRARIRKKLIPLLEKDFQPRVVEHLFALAAHAREDDALLERLAEKHLAECLENVPGGARVPIAALLASNFETRAGRETSGQQSSQYQDDASTAWSSRLIRRIVNKVKSTQATPRSGELTAVHVGQVLELARQGETGSSRPLPGGIEVRRHSDALVFCAAEPKKIAAPNYQHEIDFLLDTTLIQVPELGCAFRFTVIDWPPKRGETRDSGEVLNRDGIRFPLTLRSWRHGDVFRAKGHGKPRKLKRLFNEKRIDRWKRVGSPVLVSDGVLIWAHGLGSSAEFAVSDATQTGIVIAEEKLS
jgi:tRNA(Ile)-lysidine synthase